MLTFAVIHKAVGKLLVGGKNCLLVCVCVCVCVYEFWNFEYVEKVCEFWLDKW